MYVGLIETLAQKTLVSWAVRREKGGNAHNASREIQTLSRVECLAVMDYNGLDSLNSKFLVSQLWRLGGQDKDVCRLVPF